MIGCEVCQKEFDPNTGFMVMTEKLANGLGLIVIDAATLVEPETARDFAICGIPCMTTFMSERLSAMRGTRRTGHLGPERGARCPDAGAMPQ